ncbi:hypothetical protein DFJ73DRAFT_758470 [Zopfochytrium polystomum]|nr:hypothetical protein DFJ73DRAFT_758470 [Zopfochytrium polystomum]
MDFHGGLLNHQHQQQQLAPSSSSSMQANEHPHQQQLMHAGAATAAAAHFQSHLPFSPDQSSPLNSPSTASLLSPYSKLSFSSSSIPHSPLAPMTPLGGSAPGPDKFHPRAAAVVVATWPADRDFGEFWTLLRKRLPGFERLIVGSDDTLAVLLTSTETASHALSHIRASGVGYADTAAADILILPPPPRITPPSALPSRELVVTGGGYFTDRILEVSDGFAGWRDDPNTGIRIALFTDAGAAARCVDEIARYSNLGVDFWRELAADETEYVNANAAAAAAAERWGRSSLDGNPAAVAGEKWGRGSIDSERWETASIGSQKSGMSNLFPASPNRALAGGGGGGNGIRTIYVTSLGNTDKCDIKNFCSSLPGFYRVQFGQTNFRVVLTDPEKAIAAMSVIQSTFKGMKATFARKEPEVKIIEELGEPSRVLWTSTLYWGEAECRKFLAQLEGFEKLVFDAAHSWVHFRDVECARRALVELNSTTNLYSVFSKKFDKDGMATGVLPIGSSNSNHNAMMAAGSGLLVAGAGVGGGLGGGLVGGLGGTRLGSRSSSVASVVSNTGSVKYPQQQQQQHQQLAAATEALAFQQHQQAWIAAQVQQQQSSMPGGSLIGVPLKSPAAAAAANLSMSAANSPVLNPAAFADVSPSVLRMGSTPTAAIGQQQAAGIDKLSSSPRPTPLARMQTSLRRMASHSGFLSSSSSSSSSAPGSPLAGKFDFGKPAPGPSSGSLPRPGLLASSIMSGVETPPTTPREMVLADEEEGPSSSSSSTASSLLSFHPHLQQPIRFGSVPLPMAGASSSLLGGRSLAYGALSDEPELIDEVPAAVSNIARELERLDVDEEDDGARRNGDAAESGFGMARRMWPRTQSTPEVSLSLSSLPVGTPPHSRPLIPPPGASPATAPMDPWSSPRLPPAPGTPVFSGDPVGVGSGSPLLPSATWGNLPVAASLAVSGLGLGTSSSSTSSSAQSAWATGGGSSVNGATSLGGSTSLGRSNTLGTASDYWSGSGGAKRSPLGAFSPFVSPSSAAGTKLKRERSVDSFRSEPGVLLRSDRWVGSGLGSVDDELEPGYSAAAHGKAQPSPLGAVLMAARMGSSGSVSSVASSTGASVARSSRFDPEAKEFSTSTLDGATLFDRAVSGDDAVLGELVDAARRLAGRLKVDLAPDAGEAVATRTGQLAFLKRWFERVEAGVGST